MIKLTIQNSFCNIEGLNMKQFTDLREILSFNIPADQAYYSGFRSNKRYLLSKKGDFPTGLLDYVQGYIEDNKLDPMWVHDYNIPASRNGLFSLSLPFPPYDEQKEIVEAALANHRGTISACTGFGKSIAMALVIHRLQVRTLVVVPNLGIKRQLQEAFTQYFGSLGNITIENIDSATLDTATGYDCLIIDEAHHVAAKTYQKLNKAVWNDIYYRFFFTATPFRSKDEEQLLFESIAGQVIYRIDYKQAVEKGYVVPVQAYYVSVANTYSRGYNWQSVYNELVVNNEGRNLKICSILTNLHKSKTPTLCLVKEIKHGKALVKELGCGFASGENEECAELIAAFSAEKIKTLVGTTGVLGEGIDTKPAEYIVIAGLGKSKNQFMQQIGRGLRKYPGKESCKVILFEDTSHKWTTAHFKAQVKYLKEEYGVKPTKLDI